jgi:hypothetical protein
VSDTNDPLDIVYPHVPAKQAEEASEPAALGGVALECSAGDEMLTGGREKERGVDRQRVEIRELCVVWWENGLCSWNW